MQSEKSNRAFRTIDVSDGSVAYYFPDVGRYMVPRGWSGWSSGAGMAALSRFLCHGPFRLAKTSEDSSEALGIYI